MEGVSSRSYLVDAVTNNTFSLRSTENAILQVMYQSFNYLLNAQREFIDLNRFNFTNSDVKTCYGKFWLEASADLIEQTSRKAYRVSKFYNKELTLETMNAHREIFIKVPLLYIDGVPTFAFTVRARLDKMEIYLQIDKDFLKKPHEYTVLFIHNNGYKEIKSNKYIMDKYGNELPNNFFGPSLQTKNSGGMYFTAIRESNSPVGSTFNRTYLTQRTVNVVADKKTDDIIHSSREIQLSVINFRYIYSMEKEYTTYYKADGSLAINTVVIEGIDTEYLDMPVPVENILVLKYDQPTDQWLVDNHITVELHYPNIYTLTDENIKFGDKYKVFYFYHGATDDVRFMNKLDAYHFLLLQKFRAGADMTEFYKDLMDLVEYLNPDIWQFNYDYIAENYPYIAAIMKSDPRASEDQPNVLNMNPDDGVGSTQVLKIGDLKPTDEEGDAIEDFSKENAFDAILKLAQRNTENYQAFFDEFFAYQDGVYCYNHADFFETYHPNHFDYKTYKMREFIRKDPLSLRTYVMDQYHTGKKYFLFAKDIDLESRKRTNNHQEAKKEADHMEFDEECYMFAFRNQTDNFLNLRVFVNGLLYVPKYTLLEKNLEYFYIPCDMIDEYSWVEIERFEDYRLHEVLNMQADQPYEVRVIVDSRKTAFDAHVGDLYFVDSTTNEYIDNSLFKVETWIDGAYEDITEEQWCVLSTFRVTLLDQAYNGRDIYIKISKTPYFTSFVTTRTGMVTQTVSPHIKRSPEYFRVFANGRLLPKTAWSLMDYSIDNQEPSIRMNYQVPAGTVISIDATPYRYQRVFSMKEIPENSVIDMAPYIDKPIDLHYYDIYLNGRKLGEANVVYLSPTKVKLLNIHSSYNFEVWQKERGDEYYGFTYEDESWKTLVDRLLDSEKLTDEDKEIIIDRIVDQTLEPGFDPNENDKTEDDFFPDVIWGEEDAEMHLFYEEQLLPLLYLNPDTWQFSYEVIRRRYPHIAEDMKKDRRTRPNPNVLNLNPDLCPTAESIIKIGGYLNEDEDLNAPVLQDSRITDGLRKYSKIMLMSDYPSLSGIYVQANSIDRTAVIVRLDMSKSMLKVPTISDRPTSNPVGLIE